MMLKPLMRLRLVAAFSTFARLFDGTAMCIGRGASRVLGFKRFFSANLGSRLANIAGLGALAFVIVLASSGMSHDSTRAYAQAFDEGEDFLLLTLPQIISSQNQSSSSGGASGGSGGVIGGTTDGEITYEQTASSLIVTSTQIPSWRLEFAIGSGAPGGGVAIGLYIPSDSTDSVVETRPRRQCCNGLGLDNLEWRHRPFGGTSGIRADMGDGSTVSSFRILRETSKLIEFEMVGSWDGVDRFVRRTIITPKGFSTNLTANYVGTTGRDSMWWIMTLFNEARLDSDKVTVQDANTNPIVMRKSISRTPLPPGISFPYTVNFPLLAPSTVVKMTMRQMGDTSGNARYYEYFDNGNPHGIGIGPYYLFYPRWSASFQRRTYTFQYDWQLSP